VGTTLDALKAGSMAYDLVLAIEGYPHLLTTGVPAAAVTAWSGTDYTTALGGLYVDVQNEQTLDPWAPFQSGGKLTFYVAPDAADTFGIDVHCVAGAVKTTLVSTMDRATTAIVAQLTTAFAAASAGPPAVTPEMHIGTECIEYSATTSTTFTASKRGKYSPFAAGGTGAPRFSTHHRVGNVDYSTPLAPIVSQLPRIWKGRRMGVWMHRKAAGVLDLKAQALCLYAGRIEEIDDDGATALTVASCSHVLDEVKDAVIGRDMWTAKLDDGVYLEAAMHFDFNDFSDIGGSFETLTCFTLNVVASGASGANQINEGYYDVPTLATALNTWWASELAASRCADVYTMVLEDIDPSDTSFSDPRVKINADGGQVTWNFVMPQIVSIFFGFNDAVPYNIDLGQWTVSKTDASQTTFVGTASPYRSLVFEATDDAFNQRVALTTTSGVFVDNFAELPPGAGIPSVSGGLEWGLFIFDNQQLFCAALVGNELQHIVPAPPLMSGLTTSQPAGAPISALGRRYTDDDTPFEIKQIYAFAQPFATFWNSLMFSTGTAGYNDSTYDVYGFGIGIGIPAELLGNFAASVALLDVAGAGIQVIIDKPTKLSDLLNVDLTLRRCSLVWKNGSLQMASWSTPATAQSVALLDESNKGEPPDTVTAQRSSSLLSSDWIRNVVKIQYNRDASTGDYLANVTLEDRTSIDDAGGDAQPITLPARNAFSDAANLGAGIQALLPGFLAYMPFFSNAVRKLQRSIDSRLFEALFPGDIVTVTDKFARDPQTGIRGIVARPGLVVRVWYTLGGAQPGTPDQVNPMSGEVDIIFIDAIVAARSAQYSPAAELDATQNSSGFSAGYNDATKTLRFLPHEHTMSPGGHDTDYFAANDHVRIIEVDPDDPSSPLTWQRQIAALAGGDDIVLTATLSSPAFDATKTYRMIPDHYGACQASQQTKAFEADPTSGLVESTTAPFQYTLSTSAGVLSPISHTVPAEHHAALDDGDGKPRDTGNDAGLARTINNLIDHKTAHQSPGLDFTERANDSVSGYVLTYLKKVFVGSGTVGLGGSVSRVLAVAPFFRSKTGASVTVRVTLCSNRPVSSSYTDVAFTAFVSQASWSTTSTTYVTGAEATLDLGVINGTGWLAIEITEHCATRGLTQCIQRERT
jgi:hypothetical protein